jgi:hypothetical protein
MLKLTVIHSSKEERLSTFFNRLFLDFQAAVFWGSFKETSLLKITSQAGWKMEETGLFFLLLSPDEECRLHLQHWLNFKSTLPVQKPIWAFRHCQDTRNISASIPFLAQQVECYITPTWSDYVARLIEHGGAPEPTGPAGVQIIPFTGKLDSVFAHETGTALEDHSTSPPMAIALECPHCRSHYGLHIPSGLRVFNCLSCGKYNEIKWAVSGAKSRENTSPPSESRN